MNNQTISSYDFSRELQKQTAEKNNFRVTEAFGSTEEIERLREEAILMASVTGSVGATVAESRIDNDTNEIIDTARVTVSRI